ncbi:programmed cell death protein 10 Ccm3 isoform X2 [Brevipalpus obovatus]|uniref:programmed cell death protein 10 Ccm3 isoform X2 n=1 Tax=Brevipalpus obovatus TaxID=246614 RepID=UPI003D9ECE8E
MSVEKSSQERMSVASHLIVPILLKPLLQKLARQSSESAHILNSAIIKAESHSPGISLELVSGILKKADMNVNMTESLLRLQGNMPEIEVRRHEEPFQELNKKSVALRRILSRIPDEINDRRTFLETIKEIASAIKKLLDCVNAITNYIYDPTDKQVIEVRKREFIKYSKKFSNTLKEFFREGQSSSVYVSAAHLIHQTNLLQVTTKSKCDIR